MKYGTAWGKAMLRIAIKEWCEEIVRRPGVGALLILVAGVIIPPPVGKSTHLLGLPTLCPLRALTGVPCPGCGMTRALCLCCHGRFGEAVLIYHPVVPLVFIGLIITAAYGLRYGKPVPERWFVPASYGTGVIMIAVWTARMLHFLPAPPL